MRIVVTGASGNVGTALLRALRADSASPHEIVGICRRTPPAVPPYAEVQWVCTDLAQSASAPVLDATFAGADAVIHLAWQIQPSYDRGQLLRTNQGGSRRVMDAVVAQHVPHLVHMSSVGTYAPAPDGAAVDESWSHAGVPTSSYSVDKAAAETMLDELKAPGLTVTRVRPGLILQPDAASEIARYFLGPLVPARLLRPGLLRVVPLPTRIRLQFVHAGDVATALVAMLHQRPGGAFNLAAEPVLDRAGWRAAFGGVGPPLPLPMTRAGANASWRAHLQPTDPGWVDLAASMPLLKTDRARTELEWEPTSRADALLTTFVDALSRGRGTPSPALQPRG